MTNTGANGNRASQADGVLVRDLPVRIFHWALVAAVATAALTGFFGEENLLTIHVWAGYAIAVLLVFRVLWWFLGGRYSRISAYPLAPRKVLAHFRKVLRGDCPLHAGHNPAGAWMIVTLMTLLALLTLTGLVTLGGEEDLGPLRAFVGYRLGDAFGELHEVLAFALVAAIAGHLAGVFMEVRIFRHPLLAAMTRGRMPVPAEEAERGSLALRGLAVFAFAFGMLAMAWAALASVPDARWHEVRFLPAYQENCGDCHHAHHPLLRRADAWERIIAGLEDHYGEDASIGKATEQKLLAFLKANDASHFDTEAAVRIGRADSPDLRISSTPWWKKRHADIPRRLFTSPRVGSKANCNACHGDARSGRFDDAAIHLPETGQATTNKEKDHDS